MRKKIIGFGFVLCLLFLGLGNSVAWSASSHIYVSGTVSQVSKRTITIDDRKFHVVEDPKVLIRENISGAFHEYPGYFSSVSRGDQATIRVDGNVVNEIILER